MSRKARRITMDNVSKTKWQIRVAAFALFLLGFLAGALSLNGYYARRWPAATAGNRDRVEQMLNRLQLTKEQDTQVKKILDDMREQLVAVRKESAPKVGEIRRQADERLRQVLTPEQWTQFQQMKNEWRGRGRRGGNGEGNTGRPVEERR